MQSIKIIKNHLQNFQYFKVESVILRKTCICSVNSVKIMKLKNLKLEKYQCIDIFQVSSFQVLLFLHYLQNRYNVIFEK